MNVSTAAPSPHPGMGFKQFVVFIAAVMATNALAIDAMLPALPDIGRSFGLADELQTQWVLTSYLLGFGAAQIVYGTLSDRYGRRPVLLFGLWLYVAAAAATFFAPSFALMIAVLLFRPQGLFGRAGRTV